MSVARWEFEHASRFPSEIGLVFAERSWTNAELHACSRRFAAALLGLDVKPGDRVAVALSNSPELFIACSGAVSAGAALVVLSDSFSSELQSKIAHCEPRVLVCSSQLARDLAASSPRARMIAVGRETAEEALRFDDLVARTEPLVDFVQVSDDTLAQLCYTSGSTGKPKAVPYTHGRLDRFLRAFAEMLPERQAATTVLVCVPPTAFASRLVTLRVLANNRYVVLAQFEPERTLATIEKYCVQQMSLLPTMAEQMVACGARGGFDCSSLRSINIGGSHVSAALLAGLKKLVASGEVGESLRVAVQYGMTEAGGGIAATMEGGDGVVGAVMPGVLVRIVRVDGSDAQDGEVGEIVAKTPFGPEAYWRDAEASAKVFRSGFVHTGDLGYFREDGQLCLVGRSKEVIIQGGVNVYPAELIKVIYAIPGVRECAVVGCPNQVLGEEVVACVVRMAGARLSESHIRWQCRQALDPSKQPVRIVFLDELPRRDGGKVDLEGLRREVSTQATRARVSRHGAPAVSLSEAHEIVTRELRTILLDEGAPAKATEQLDPRVPFGELGLSSLGAVRLAHALQECLDLHVPASLAYSCPTIEACSEWLATSGVVRPLGVARTVPAGPSSMAQAIAIVGMGVRLPGGVGTPSEFWELLWSERETVAEAPSERRAGARPGWRAAFLPNVADFDAPFFRLTADAAEIDPRHRQLLEVCWEALENSGIDPTALCSGRTGVFLGLSGERYATRNPLGAALGMAAGYLCHFFDIRGPVVTLDTTCSSSLVALHHAVESLHRQECDLAIVGSANLLVAANTDDPLGVISKDGCTRAFSVAASGFGQGEGSLVLILRRLEDALSSEDRVYACVLGSAINHDGRSSSLTAPNPQSQARLIALALQAARVAPECVQYIEAHGTGTLLGDPIEVDGIVSSMGSGRRTPLSIGSVKSNIGHLEAAAGLAGVAKVALAIWRRRLPATRHCTHPTPRIPWAQLPVRVQSSRGQWPEPHQRLIAGVSSFGMSGTNAHAVLAELPQNDGPTPTGVDSCVSAERCWLLPISARTEAALRMAVERWIRALEQDEQAASCRDIAYSASCRRAHLPFRIAVAGSSHQEWAVSLREQLARGAALANHPAPAGRKLAVAFSGQGSQWNGMARDLLGQEAVFRDALIQCTKLIEARTGWSVIEELHRDDAESRLDATEITQPTLFAVQVALYELWKSWGIEVAAVVGHSAGEIAAAYAAGALTLQEAVQVICERGRVCGVAPRGLMLALSISPVEAEQVCAQFPGELEIAAINSPRSVVLSGSLQAAEGVVKMLKARGVKVRVLPGAYAFHSRQMQAAATALRGAIIDPPSRRPRIPLISGMTAAPAEHLSGHYWSRQLLEPVRFSDAVHALLREGCSAFLEVGPHPVLLPAILEVFEHEGCAGDALAVGSLQRGRGGLDPLLDSLGLLYCAGAPINWACRYEVRGQQVDLPGYPWEHRPYWHESAPAPRAAHEHSAAGALEHERRGTVTSNPAAVLREVLSGLIDRPVEELHEHSSLHELAIDSLGLIRLGARLAGWVGGAPLVPAPETTLKELLEWLTGAPSSRSEVSATASGSSPLCWLRRHGEEPTHIWIHPAGGGIDCYRPLARDTPFRSIAIDSPALRTGESAPASSVEGLAAQYLGYLEQIGLTQSLVLLGWSFGGVMAFEMAVQLARQGRRVVEVVLIDSFLGEALPNVWRSGSLPLHVSADAPSWVRDRLREIQQAHLVALEQYRPQRYDGPVRSFRAIPVRGDPDAIWHEVATDLRVLELEADHFSILHAAAKAALLTSGVRTQCATT